MHLLMIVMYFGANFHDFSVQKTAPKPKRRKHATNYVLLKDNLCFLGSRHLFFGLKTMKNGVGTRKGFGGDLFMIFDGFGHPFGAPKSRKIDQTSISKFDRFLDAFWEGSGAPLPIPGSFASLQPGGLGSLGEGRVGGRTPLPRDLSYVRSFVLSFLRSWDGSAHAL